MTRYVIFLTALLMCVSSAQSQGNLQAGFHFRNWGGPLGTTQEIVDEVGIFNADGTPLPNQERFNMEALVGPPSGDLKQVATTDMASFDVPGLFDGGIRTVPGFYSGDEVVFNIRAWDGNVGATFAEARTEGVGFGFSGEFKVTLGPSEPIIISPGGEIRPLPTSRPGSRPGEIQRPAHLEGFEGFSLVPEPSTIILAMLGMGAFVLPRWVR